MCSMSKDVQYKRGCTVQARMYSTSEDVQCKSGTSSVQVCRSSRFGTGKHHSKILPNGRLQKSINYEIPKKSFSFHQFSL